MFPGNSYLHVRLMKFDNWTQDIKYTDKVKAVDRSRIELGVEIETLTSYWGCMQVRSSIFGKFKSKMHLRYLKKQIYYLDKNLFSISISRLNFRI